MFRSGQLVVVGLVAGLVAGGCDRGPGFGTAKGTVTFDGKPLPGGLVVFTNEADNLMASGYLRPDGSYEIHQVPAGPVRVVIQNDEFKNQIDERTVKALQKKGVPIVVENDPNKGTKYVPIPTRYADREKSGLRFEVKRDAVTEITIKLAK